MFIYIKKLTFLTIFFFLLYSCNLKPSNIHHGVINLEQKQILLEVNKSNKNDVVSLLGESIVKEYPNENIWIYIESDEKKNFLGKKIIQKSFVLKLEFDNKGIINSKQLLDINDLKDIKFDEEITKTFYLKNTFSKKFLASIRKRFEAKTSSNEQN